jgi:hypothetical protein
VLHNRGRIHESVRTAIEIVSQAFDAHSGRERCQLIQAVLFLETDQPGFGDLRERLELWARTTGRQEQVRLAKNTLPANTDLISGRSQLRGPSRGTLRLGDK